MVYIMTNKMVINKAHYLTVAGINGTRVKFQ